MRRVLALVVPLFLICACGPKKTVAPVDLGTEPVSDASGQMEVQMGFIDRPGKEIELTFKMNAVGLEEMDKLVLDVILDQMVIVNGGVQWSGFVPPRQPQSHSVTVKPLDDAEEPQVRVTVSRSHDSKLLMERVIRFTPDGSLIAD